MHVLVTGATGFVGGYLVPALLAAGHSVRALVRDPDGYAPPDGVDVAYYLVHSMRAGSDYAERDRRAARNFRRAADEAGVDRVVYLGGLGEDDETLSEHRQSRREVEFILADGAYDLTTFRAAVIIGAGSASFRMIRELTTRLPVMLTPRWVRTECHLIAIDDVIAYLVGVLDAPETAGETYEIGGPEVLTYAEILKRTGRLMSAGEPKIVPIPVLTPKLSAYWVALMTDVPSSVARPLIHGLRTPVVADTEAAQAQFAVDQTSFADAVRPAFSGPRSRDAAQAAAAAGGAAR